MLSQALNIIPGGSGIHLNPEGELVGFDSLLDFYHRHGARETGYIQIIHQAASLSVMRAFLDRRWPKPARVNRARAIITAILPAGATPAPDPARPKLWEKAAPATMPRTVIT